MVEEQVSKQTMKLQISTLLTDKTGQMEKREIS